MNHQRLQQPDLNASSFKANPHPFYDWLRLHDPIPYLTLPSGRKAWMITRYDDAIVVLKDPRIVKDIRKIRPDLQASSSYYFQEHLIGLDPPDHTRLRSLIGQAFTPRMIERWREPMEEYAQCLIHQMKQSKGLHDLVEEFAFPFSLLVLTHLLGIPQQDSPSFHRWSQIIVESFGNPEASPSLGEEIQQFAAYLHTLIARRRGQPAEDLLGALIEASDRGDSLSEQELVASLFQLLVAGHETTAHFLSNAVLSLLLHPAQLEWLRNTPHALPGAIEELLRYQGSVFVTSKRWAAEALELGNKHIQKGEAILVSLSAVNHDPTAFSCPETLDVTREKCKHLTFGHGIHYCLGAALARVEAEIALGALLSQFEHLRLAVDPETLRWRPGIFMLGLQHLPIIWEKPESQERRHDSEGWETYLFDQSGYL